MKIMFALLFMVMLSSCDEHFEEKELNGSYIPVNYKNTFDTIELKSLGVYHRRVFDKNNKLVLEMDGNWKLEKKLSYVLNHSS